jgi:dTMP kinase
MPHFIVIEGLDGSGKSTQCRMLEETFFQRGLPVLATRQPTETAIGELIRDALHKVFPVENDTIALLFAADRVQHYFNVILPALESGKNVVCDRYFYSNLVYQGSTDEEYARVAAYNKLVMEALQPSHVFFLDAPPLDCIARLEATRKDDGRRSGLSIYEARDTINAQRRRYMRVFEELTPNVHSIQTGDADPDEVHRRICSILFA